MIGAKLMVAEPMFVSLERRSAPGEAGRRVSRNGLVALTVTMGLAVVFLFAPRQHDPGWARLGDIAFLVVGPLVATTFWSGVKRMPASDRRGWTTIAVALSILAAADVVWAQAGLRGAVQMYPGPADVAYLTGYGVLFVGVVLLLGSGPQDRGLRWYLDGLIGTVAIGLVAWHAFLGEAVSGAIAAGSMATRIVSVLYPLVDLLNITALMLLLIRPVRHRSHAGIIALVAALAFLILADGVYFSQVATGTYWSGNRLTSLWLLWYSGLALAGGSLTSTWRSARLDRHQRWSLLPTYFAVTFLLVQHLFDTVRGVEHTFIDVGTIIVLGMVVVRQTIAITEGRREVETQRHNLVASVSHELRTPLAAVYGFTSLLTEGSIPSGERDEMIALVHQQTGHLNRIVSDLVDVARGNLARTNLNRRSVEVGAVVAEAVGVSGIGAGIEVELQPALRLECDEIRMRQILVNLLSNAIKYGGKTILVVGDLQGDAVTLEVHDDGPGVPRRFQESIWREFERGVHARDDRTPGSGLGLAIARSLARAHGGDLTYRSSERLGGACFTLSLPVS
jgi:signal transduction histidine kinase